MNCDLYDMIDAPGVAECPRCKREVETEFDDIDPESRYEDGVWTLRVWCEDCEDSFHISGDLTAVEWKVV